MKAPQQEQNQERKSCDKPVIRDLGIEIEAESRRTDDATDAVFTACDIGPTKRHRIKHCCERECQKREVNTTPTQNQKPERNRDQNDDEDRTEGRPEERSGHHIALKQCCSVGGKAEPGAVAKRHQPRMTDEDIQCHTGDAEHDDFGRRGYGEAKGNHQRRQDNQTDGSNDQLDGNTLEHVRQPHSKRMMRSPNRPRGLNTSTRSISR